MEVEPHPGRNRRSGGVCWRDPGRAAGPRTSWLDYDSRLIRVGVGHRTGLPASQFAVYREDYVLPLKALSTRLTLRHSSPQ
jgi:hypothetical protein